jgi:type IV pilus assembly protein PilC
MADFSYVVRTQDGVRKEGTVSANNYNEAMEQLVNDKYIVVKLHEKDTSFDFMGPFLDRLSLAFEKFKFRIPLNVLVFFTRQLSTMFSAGLTIERAFYFLSAEEKHKKFKVILETIERDIRRGMLLSDALERHPGAFSNLYISLVRAGEVSGKLSQTLEELAVYLETLEDTRRKVQSAMYYPVFIIGFLVVMLIVTFTFIIPQFATVYDTLGSDLPAYTVMMVNMGEWFQANFFFVIFMIVFVQLILWMITLTDSGRLIKDKVFFKVPVFGKLIEQSILSKFSKTFGLLINAGVSVIESLSLVHKVVDNRVFELAIVDATKNITEGASISAALRDTGVFPPIMIQLLSTGEETGEIDNLLLKASDFYTKQVNATIDRMTSIIEPALIIFVGVVVGIIVVVTYLPIFHFGAALN